MKRGALFFLCLAVFLSCSKTSSPPPPPPAKDLNSLIIGTWDDSLYTPDLNGNNIRDEEWSPVFMQPEMQFDKDSIGKFIFSDGFTTPFRWEIGSDSALRWYFLDPTPTLSYITELDDQKMVLEFRDSTWGWEWHQYVRVK